MTAIAYLRAPAGAEPDPRRVYPAEIASVQVLYSDEPGRPVRPFTSANFRRYPQHAVAGVSLLAV